MHCQGSRWQQCSKHTPLVEQQFQQSGSVPVKGGGGEKNNKDGSHNRLNKFLSFYHSWELSDWVKRGLKRVANMVTDQPLLLRSKIMDQKSMLVLSKLHQEFSWSSLDFSASSYYLVDWHLFLAFILVSPKWTSFTVYLLCWTHGRDWHDSPRGHGKQWSKPKN